MSQFCSHIGRSELSEFREAPSRENDMRKGSGPSPQQIFNRCLKLSLVFAKRASRQGPGNSRQALTCFWFAERRVNRQALYFGSFVQVRKV